MRVISIINKKINRKIKGVKYKIRYSSQNKISTFLKNLKFKYLFLAYTIPQ